MENEKLRRETARLFEALEACDASARCQDSRFRRNVRLILQEPWVQELKAEIKGVM